MLAALKIETASRPEVSRHLEGRDEQWTLGYLDTLKFETAISSDPAVGEKTWRVRRTSRYARPDAAPVLERC